MPQKILNSPVLSTEYFERVNTPDVGDEACLIAEKAMGRFREDSCDKMTKEFTYCIESTHYQKLQIYLVSLKISMYCIKFCRSSFELFGRIDCSFLYFL